MLSRARTKLDLFFFGPVSAKPLALLRIFLGIMMLTEAFFIFASLDDLYGPGGFLQAGLMGALGTKTAPYYSQLVENLGLSYSTALHAIFAIRCLALVSFTLGFRTRLSTFIVWLSQIFFVYSGEMSSYGVDRYFHLILFLLLWAPAGRAFSVDQWHSRQKESFVSAWSLRLVQLAILVTYIDAGISKASGHMWWSGEAVWRVANMPEFQQADFTWLASVPLVAKALAVGTIALESLYFLALLIPYVNVAWTFAIIGMHLSIAFLMGLTNFGITMALINVALFLYPRFTSGPLLKVGHALSWGAWKSSKSKPTLQLPSNASGAPFPIIGSSELGSA